MDNRNLKIGPNGSNLYVGDINILGGQSFVGGIFV